MIQQVAPVNSAKNRRYIYSFLLYKKILCEALILSNFNFGDVAFEPCLDSYVKRLQVPQNSYFSLICGVWRHQLITRKLQDVN